MNPDSPKEEAKRAEEKMLDAIRKGEVEMIPHWHFVLKTVLMITGGILALLVLLYLASFVVFSLRQTGAWFAPIFGAAGWYSLLRSMPWILVALLAIFIIVLAILVRRYAFVYKHPFVYLFIGIVAVVAIGGFAIAQTPFHQFLFDSSRHGRLPVLSGFYRGFGPQRVGEIHRGTVISTTTDGFILQDANGDTSTAVFGSRLRTPPNRMPTIGSDVVIFGSENQSGTITIQGIQPVRN